MDIDIKTLDEVAESLAQPAFYYFDCEKGLQMPSLPALDELMQRLRAALFPGFHSPRRFSVPPLRYHLAANLDSIH